MLCESEMKHRVLRILFRVFRSNRRTMCCTGRLLRREWSGQVTRSHCWSMESRGVLGFTLTIITSYLVSVGVWLFVSAPSWNTAIWFTTGLVYTQRFSGFNHSSTRPIELPGPYFRHLCTFFAFSMEVLDYWTPRTSINVRLECNRTTHDAITAIRDGNNWFGQVCRLGALSWRFSKVSFLIWFPVPLW